MAASLFHKYLHECKVSWHHSWGFLELRSLLIHYPRWRRSQNPDRNPLVDEIPWVTFSAICCLEKILRRDMRVFEYGAGGSTLFFAKRVAEVVSVEHDREWAERVEKCVRDRGFCNSRIVHAAALPDASAKKKSPADPHACVSGSPNYNGYDFSRYVRVIDGYPDRFFDVILVDGRARPSCFLRALPKVKEGGYIFWDNTDREWYAPAMLMVPAEYQFMDFPGPSPYVDFFTRTSAWWRNGGVR